jgi:hypothetical protein
MAVTINLNSADLYFAEGNHVLFDTWAEIDPLLRESGVAHAKRTVSAHLKVDVETLSIDADAMYYPDRAVYEQAMFMLTQQGPITQDGDYAQPDYMSTRGPDDMSGKAGMDGVTLSPQALNWLGRRYGRVTIARG